MHCIGVGFTGNIGIANIIVAVIIVIIVLVAINIMRKKGTCQCGDDDAKDSGIMQGF